jgi:hypothetical protein
MSGLTFSVVAPTLGLLLVLGLLAWQQCNGSDQAVEASLSQRPVHAVSLQPDLRGPE